jgi:hypothetical protein
LILKVLDKTYLSDKRNDFKETSSLPIYSAFGCIFLFRKVFFERGGSLASKAMMYHEEFLIAERCRRMGLRIMMNTDLHVVHNEYTVTKLVKIDIQRGWMKSLSHVLIDIYRTGEKDTWISLIPQSKHSLQ